MSMEKEIERLKIQIEDLSSALSDLKNEMKNMQRDSLTLEDNVVDLIWQVEELKKRAVPKGKKKR